MAIKIAPQDKARPVSLSTEIHPDLLRDFKSYCESIDSSQSYVLGKIVEHFVRENRKEIDAWLASQNTSLPLHEIPIVDKSTAPTNAKPRRNGKELIKDQLGAIASDLEKTDRNHMDTRLSPAGGAVLLPSS